MEELGANPLPRACHAGELFYCITFTDSQPCPAGTPG